MYAFLYLLALVLVVYKWIIYPVYLSPLAKIPNAHWLAPLTGLWIHWRRFRGKEVVTVWDAIRIEGPVVRLGPKELVVNNYDSGVRIIYGRGFEKPGWYNFFINHGKRNIFTSLGNDHTHRRRRITSIYSKTFVQESTHVREILRTLLFERYIPQLVQSAQAKEPLGVLGLNLAYGLDSVSAFMVGLPRGTLFIQDVDARNAWLGEYLKSHPNDYMFWLLEAPWVIALGSKLGFNVVPKWVAQAHHTLEDWAIRLVDETENALTAISEETTDGAFPLVYHRLRQSLSREREISGMAWDKASSYEGQRLELASETLDQLVATRDVFGITFTYIIWEISKHLDWQRELQRELRALKKPLVLSSKLDATSMITPKELESLPVLHAVIKESLRLRGTLPVPNPRVTPHDRETTIGPYENIPGGVRTNSFAWCLHRDTSVYPDPEEWKPERWLDPSAERELMERQFWAFGSGSRLCLGMSLAMEMIRYATAAIFTNFTVTVADDQKFGADGSFVTGLPGEDLILRFEGLPPLPVEQNE